MRRILLIILSLGLLGAEDDCDNTKPNKYNDRLWCHWLPVSYRPEGVAESVDSFGCFCSVLWNSNATPNITWVPNKFCGKE